jgi:type IV fimbrial biogenesis protein FimT
MAVMISLSSNRPSSNTADRGFTLLELMVTVSIAAILSVMALPAFHAFVLNDRDIAQINSLVASFNYARSEAVKQNLSTGIMVCPSGDGSSCNGTTAWSGGWIVWNTNAAVPKGQMVLQAVPALAGRNTLTATGAAAAGITFQSTGMVDGPLTIVVCDPRGAAYALDVEVNATGRVAASQTPGKSVSGLTLKCS